MRERRARIIIDVDDDGALGMLKRAVGLTITAPEINNLIRLKGRNHPDVTDLFYEQKKLNEAAARSHNANKN